MSPIYRLLAFLPMVLLLAGCQSSRPAFYFGTRPTPVYQALASSPDSLPPAPRPAVTPRPAPAQPPRTFAPPRRRLPQRPVLRPLVRRAAAALAAKRPAAPQRPLLPGRGHRSATPILVLLSAGALVMLIALGIGSLDFGLVAVFFALACLAAVLVLLLVRTIWPRSVTQARPTNQLATRRPPRKPVGLARPFSASPPHRPAWPVVTMMSFGAVAVAASLIDGYLTLTPLLLYVGGAALLLAGLVVLLVRTIWPLPASAARTARRRYSQPSPSKGSWLQIAAWVLGLGGLGLGIVLGGWLGAAVAAVLIVAAVLLGLAGSMANGNLP